MTPLEILERLDARVPGKITRAAGIPPDGNWNAVIDREHVLPILAYLREDPETAFDFLSDVTGVDYLLMESETVRERFAVVYQLYSLSKNHRFQLKARVPESDPRVPSVLGLWQAALWGERETHDMYGIEFEGNPDMRRLLMPEDYPGFPLRKDYPLRGQGERDAFRQHRSVPEALRHAGETPAPPAGGGA